MEDSALLLEVAGQAVGHQSLGGRQDDHVGPFEALDPVHGGQAHAPAPRRAAGAGIALAAIPASLGEAAPQPFPRTRPGRRSGAPLTAEPEDRRREPSGPPRGGRRPRRSSSVAPSWVAVPVSPPAGRECRPRREPCHPGAPHRRRSPTPAPRSRASEMRPARRLSAPTLLLLGDPFDHPRRYAPGWSPGCHGEGVGGQPGRCGRGQPQPGQHGGHAGALQEPRADGGHAVDAGLREHDLRSQKRAVDPGQHGDVPWRPAPPARRLRTRSTTATPPSPTMSMDRATRSAGPVGRPSRPPAQCPLGMRWRLCDSRLDAASTTSGGQR